jgi:hypothetical protein
MLMPRCARTLRALPAAVLLALAIPSAAIAGSAFNEVFKNFEQNGGAINPCTLSDTTLKAALGQIPNDLQQYASDIERAIKAALAARARGACDKVAKTAPPPPAATTTTTTTPAPPTTQGATGTTKPAKPILRVQVPPTPPASGAPASNAGTVYPAESVGAHTSSGPPAALILLGALAAGLALLALVAATARALGFEPRWSLGVRHAFAEAGYRTAGVWAEFADWVRFGR